MHTIFRVCVWVVGYNCACLYVRTIVLVTQNSSGLLFYYRNGNINLWTWNMSWFTLIFPKSWRRRWRRRRRQQNKSWKKYCMLLPAIDVCRHRQYHIVVFDSVSTHFTTRERKENMNFIDGAHRVASNLIYSIHMNFSHRISFYSVWRALHSHRKIVTNQSKIKIIETEKNRGKKSTKRKVNLMNIKLSSHGMNTFNDITIDSLVCRNQRYEKYWNRFRQSQKRPSEKGKRVRNGWHYEWLKASRNRPIHQCIKNKLSHFSQWFYFLFYR